MNTIMLLIKSFPIFKRNGLRFTVGLRQINWKYQIYFWKVQKHKEKFQWTFCPGWTIKELENGNLWMKSTLNLVKKVWLLTCTFSSSSFLLLPVILLLPKKKKYCYQRKHLEETVSFIHWISTEDYVPCQYLELTEEQIKLEEISSADESCFYFQEIDVRPSHLLGHQFIVLTSQSISIRNLSIPCRPTRLLPIPSINKNLLIKMSMGKWHEWYLLRSDCEKKNFKPCRY
jgi:hypothetical protein